MKKLITFCLCSALLALPLEAKEKPQPNGVVVWVFVLLCVGAAAGVTIYLCTTSGTAPANSEVVVEVSHYDGVWTPVRTNIVLTRTNLQELLRLVPHDEFAQYRAVVRPIKK